MYHKIDGFFKKKNSTSREEIDIIRRKETVSYFRYGACSEKDLASPYSLCRRYTSLLSPERMAEVYSEPLSAYSSDFQTMHMAASYTAPALQEYEAPLDGAIAPRLSIFGETFFACEREMPWPNEYRAELVLCTAPSGLGIQKSRVSALFGEQPDEGVILPDKSLARPEDSVNCLGYGRALLGSCAAVLLRQSAENVQKRYSYLGTL